MKASTSASTSTRQARLGAQLGLPPVAGADVPDAAKVSWSTARFRRRMPLVMRSSVLADASAGLRLVKLSVGIAEGRTCVATKFRRKRPQWVSNVNLVALRNRSHVRSTPFATDFLSRRSTSFRASRRRHPRRRLRNANEHLLFRCPDRRSPTFVRPRCRRPRDRECFSHKTRQRMGKLVRNGGPGALSGPNQTVRLAKRFVAVRQPDHLQFISMSGKYRGNHRDPEAGFGKRQ